MQREKVVFLKERRYKRSSGAEKRKSTKEVEKRGSGLGSERRLKQKEEKVRRKS